jgi:hypothetical protein
MKCKDVERINRRLLQGAVSEVGWIGILIYLTTFFKLHTLQYVDGRVTLKYYSRISVVKLRKAMNHSVKMYAASRQHPNLLLLNINLTLLPLYQCA